MYVNHFGSLGFYLRDVGEINRERCDLDHRLIAFINQESHDYMRRENVAVDFDSAGLLLGTIEPSSECGGNVSAS